MKNNQNRGPSQRQLRVGEQLRHIIADTLRRGHLHDERLLGMAEKLTVSEVRATPDLKQATAYISVLGGADDKIMHDILEALNEDAPLFQKEINAQSNLKFTPRVRFRHDDTIENVQKLEGILSNLKYSEQE